MILFFKKSSTLIGQLMPVKNCPNEYERLISIIRRLRGNDGCSWDIKQTPESLKKYLLEETQELAEALELADSSHICEEIGDLFYILILLIIIHEEQGKFTGKDVFEAISSKMIRRHPHVFAGLKTAGKNELRRQWQEIKDQEKIKK